MDMIGEDQRIGPSHVSLYMAILQLYKQQEYKIPVAVNRKVLMKHAKMSAKGTYHKCMRDLNDGGYIQYIPSYRSSLKSLIYFQAKSAS
jgi:hypothetical protein